MYNTAYPSFILRHGEASRAGAAVIFYWYCFCVFFPLLCFSSPDWECQRGAHHSLGEVSKGTDWGCQGENFASFGLDFRVRGRENIAPSLKNLRMSSENRSPPYSENLRQRTLWSPTHQFFMGDWSTTMWAVNPGVAILVFCYLIVLYLFINHPKV